MNIGEAVKEGILALCNERDISINKLSSISGVTQSTVNNIVSGRNRSATVSKIKKLCNGLGITIEDFFNSDLFRDLEQEIQKKCGYATSPIALISTFSQSQTCYCTLFQDIVFYLYRGRLQCLYLLLNKFSKITGLLSLKSMLRKFVL